MNGDNLFLGIDSGTQGTKGIVFSETTGRVLSTEYQGYGIVENPRGGREQHPDIWLDACWTVIKKLCDHPEVETSKIRAIGVSGQQHGLVALDMAGEVIRPAKLWCDTETVRECEELTDAIGGEAEVIAATGNLFAAGFTASKLLWLKKNEPHNYDRIETVLLPHDYINFWLTGERLAEPGDASGTAYFDVRKKAWSESVLRTIDRSGKLLRCVPPLVESMQPWGWVRKSLAVKLGLPENVLVASGGGDNMMGAIGTGNVVPGVVTLSLGTSGTIYAYSDRPVHDDQGELAAFCSSSGGWLPLVCTMNGTVATELTRKLFGFDLNQMNEAVGRAEIGSGGLLLLPYFQGERTPILPEATASLSGINSMNYTPENIARASMEGATFGLRYGLEVMIRNGIEPSEIRLVGGGAKSKEWRRMVADIFGRRVVTLENGEAGALGGALQSLWAWRNHTGDPVSLEELVGNYVRTVPEENCEPDPARVAEYAEVYQKYLELNKTMYGGKKIRRSE